MPGTMPMSTYTMDQIGEALNSAADDILDAADLPDTGTRDAVNFLVNVAGERLSDPNIPLAQVAREGYSIDTAETENFQHLPEEERPLAVILGWIEE